MYWKFINWKLKRLHLNKTKKREDENKCFISSNKTERNKILVNENNQHAFQTELNLWNDYILKTYWCSILLNNLQTKKSFIQRKTSNHSNSANTMHKVSIINHFLPHSHWNFLKLRKSVRTYQYPVIIHIDWNFIYENIYSSLKRICLVNYYNVCFKF